MGKQGNASCNPGVGFRAWLNAKAACLRPPRPANSGPDLSLGRPLFRICIDACLGTGLPFRSTGWTRGALEPGSGSGWRESSTGIGAQTYQNCVLGPLRSRLHPKTYEEVSAVT